MYAKVLGLENKRRFIQTAWNYMNDSLRSDVFMRFSPESITCACLHLTARQEQIVLPNNPPWFHLANVTEDVMTEIGETILRLDARPRVTNLWCCFF